MKTTRLKSFILGLIAVTLIFSAGCVQQGQETTTIKQEITSTSVVATMLAEKTSIQLVQTLSLGRILVDRKGMTLYTFKNDVSGKSNCYDQCDLAWPPFLLKDELSVPDEVLADFGTTIRTDGSKQVTYKGMPLYYYMQDQKAGDVTGEGVKGVWYAAWIRDTPTTSITEVTATTSLPSTTQSAATTSTAATATTFQNLMNAKVDIQDFAFKLSELTIGKGGTVTWTNMDSTPHTVTSDSGDELSSDTLSQGSTYSHTFKTEGVYEYHCSFHSGMRGKIIVGNVQDTQTTTTIKIIRSYTY